MQERQRGTCLFDSKSYANFPIRFLERMLAAMRTERGVHPESILGALGSLAGYSCQASLPAQARSQGLDEAACFVRAEAVDGTVYYFGDALNKPLAEDRYSVWSMAAGAAQAAGC